MEKWSKTMETWSTKNYGNIEYWAPSWGHVGAILSHLGHLGAMLAQGGSPIFFLWQSYVEFIDEQNRGSWAPMWDHYE